MPVSSVPPEVLTQIFIYCLPTIDRDRLDPGQAPALLCTISSSWRGIALSEPSLWDTVILPAAEPDANSGSTSLHGLTPKHIRRFIGGEGIGRWFDRTGPTRLLTLGEELNDDIYPPRSSHVFEISEVVKEYGPERFKHLSLVFTQPRQLKWLNNVFAAHQGDPHAREVIHPNQRTYIALRSISISRGIYFGRPQSRWGVINQPAHEIDTLLDHTPQLTHLKLTLYERYDIRVFLGASGSHLTSIELRRRLGWLEKGDWVLLFQACPNLVKAIVSAPFRSITLPPSPVYTHDNLKSLSVENSRAVEMKLGHFPRPMDFPNLESLHIGFLGYNETRTGDLLQHLQCFGSLRSLSITTAPQAEGQGYGVPGDCTALVHDMIKQPRALPFLTSLTLPYRTNRAVEELGWLLRSHGPTEDHPGLTVTATLVSDDRDEEEYDGGLEREGDISGRFNLAGIVSPVLPTISLIE